jgi:hypothetical protein
VYDGRHELLLAGSDGLRITEGGTREDKLAAKRRTPWVILAGMAITKNHLRTAPKKAATKTKVAPAKAAPAKAAPAKAAPAKSGGTKTAAKRVTPKESPLKGMPVEQWLKEKTSGWQAEAVGRLVGLVQQAAPEATSSIKWGQPVFESNGPFAYIRPAKAHVTLGFWRGTEIADPEKLLSGDGDRMAHMKITSLDQIDPKALAAMIENAVRLNREKGNPAVRAKG